MWMGVFLENECPDVHKEKYRASILRTTRSSHSRNKASDAIGGWYLSKAYYVMCCWDLLGVTTRCSSSRVSHVVVGIYAFTGSSDLFT